MIKVCINNHCDAVYHNCDKSTTKCLNCNYRLIAINQDTYEKKYKNNWFQYDVNTGRLLRNNKQQDLFIKTLS